MQKSCILNSYHSDPRIQSPFLGSLMGGFASIEGLHYNVGAAECVPIHLRLRLFKEARTAAFHFQP